MSEDNQQEPDELTHAVPTRLARLNADSMRELQWEAIVQLPVVKAHCAAIDEALVQVVRAPAALIVTTSLEYSFNADEVEGQNIAKVLCKAYQRRQFSTTYVSWEPQAPGDPAQNQKFTVTLSWKV